MLGSGHSEGDVMALGGWASRDMLNRYGASAADLTTEPVAEEPR